MVKKFDKIVIWGYPHYSCSHSFIHSAFYRAFKYLGYDVYWFDDKPQENFDFKNTLFISEGNASNNIPLDKSSYYFIHVLKDPNKYIGNVKQLIDLRYLVSHINDGIYNYTTNFSNLQNLSTGYYIEKNYEEYAKCYIAWATNLLPDEINYDWVNIERDKKYYYIGNWNDQKNTSGSIHNNVDSILKFAQILKQKNNIEFERLSPVSFVDEIEHIKLTQKSFVCPDFRGPKQHEWKYVPCRVFKSISYGHLGAGNSDSLLVMDNFLDGNYIHSNNIEELHEKIMSKKDDKKFILNQMKLVKEKNTYLERVKGILKTVEML